ncbi:hypothetical protein PENTCL1PPCAC_27623, partial [Pristionchus entomophagus]
LPVDAPEPATAAAAPVADAAPAAAPPPARKRGRPSKSVVPQVQQSEAQSDSAVLDQSATDEPMLHVDASEPVTAAAAAAASAVNLVPTAAAATSPTDPPPSRKRGRTSKSLAHNVPGGGELPPDKVRFEMNFRCR